MLQKFLSDHDFQVKEISGQHSDYLEIQKLKYQKVNKANYGQITKVKKERIILLVQYKAGSTGINLEAFNRMIFYSPTTSSGEYKQAIKRIHRIGQKKVCFYYQIININSVEESIYKANQQGVDYTLKMFKNDHFIKNDNVKKYFMKKNALKKYKQIKNETNQIRQYNQSKIKV